MRRSSRIPAIETLLLVALALLSLLNSSAAGPKSLRVVTTILPVYCFASGVIGPDGEVTNLLPPSVGPHDYQLSPSDLRKIKEADLVVINGLGLDNWALKAVDPAHAKKVLDLGALLDKSVLVVTPADLDLEGKHQHAHEHQHGPANPHIWLDPQLAIACVSNIANAVKASNPAYAKNAEAYITRLKKLDADIATELTPIRSKPFITQHDAFPYFVRRYELKQVGILEPTPDVPPSPRFLADVLKVVREKNVQVIFNDPRSSPRLVKQVARDAKIRMAELDTIETGPANPQAYEQTLRRDAATLVRELR